MQDLPTSPFGDVTQMVMGKSLGSNRHLFHLCIPLRNNCTDTSHMLLNDMLDRRK